MKKTLQSLVLAAALLGPASLLKAQQDPYVTHYMFNRAMYNPGAIGAGGKFCLSAMSHYQYTAYEDRTPEFHSPLLTDQKPVKSVGPKTQMFGFSAPLNFGTNPDGTRRNFGGLGIGFINDKLGYEFSTNVKLQACGRLPLANGAGIALGLEYDFLQKGVQGKRLLPLAQGDPRIPTSTVSDMKGNYTAGVYYHNPLLNSGSWKDAWGGISATNLKKQTYQFGSPAIIYTNTEMHVYAMGGATKTDFLGNPDLQFLPSAMMKFKTVFQLDATALLQYQERLWGGLAYRTTSDAVSIMLGYSGFNGKFRGLRVGYSYDLTLSRLIRVSSGTHELQLNYCFELSIPPPPIKRILNPRHLDKNPDLD